tara:strand:- start:14079 stop:14327 length:249 start_codon:yes stop_codon:yes gene_type:complete
MVDNQHKKITGYRDLSEIEINLINEGKALAEQVSAFIGKVDNVGNNNTNPVIIDIRWLSIAQTDLQKGFMCLIRSIARPGTF